MRDVRGGRQAVVAGLFALALFAAGALYLARRHAGEPKPALATVQVSAAELAHDYDGNEVAADQRWRGRPVRLTGVIQDIGRDVNEAPYVTLDTGDLVRTVACFFDSRRAGAVAGLVKGHPVVLRGVVTGRELMVSVKDCDVEQPM
jgi:hypothetical protein